MEDKIKEIIVECFNEFCECVGNSPAGCDACPYGEYGDRCFEEYKKKILKD